MDEKNTDCMIIRNLTKMYGSREKIVALKNINMSIKKGEFACIVGPSGCGKSTLLNIIAGFEKPTEGEIKLCGKDISGPGSDRGMVFQSYTLFPWLTVKQNIQYGLKLKKLSKEKMDNMTFDYLEKINMKKFADTLPKNLSGGMKQRVAIARTLINCPDVLLMDEPFGALDAHTKSQMQAFVRELWNEDHQTIIFITHDIEEAVFLSSKIYVMSSNPGEIIEEIDNTLPIERELKTKDTVDFIERKNYVRDLLYSYV